MSPFPPGNKKTHSIPPLPAREQTRMEPHPNKQSGWTSPACSMASTSFTRIGGAGSGGENCSARSASTWPGRKGQGEPSCPLCLLDSAAAQLGTQRHSERCVSGVISEVYHKESASPGVGRTRDSKSAVCGSRHPALQHSGVEDRRMAGFWPAWVTQNLSPKPKSAVQTASVLGQPSSLEIPDLYKHTGMWFCNDFVWQQAKLTQVLASLWPVRSPDSGTISGLYTSKDIARL